ncbi:MAG: hypothetical protein ACREO0_10310 [Pseudoxanthomonas sp.]
MHPIVPTLLATMAVSPTPSLQAAEPPAPVLAAAAQGCDAAQSRQFDFWLGQWEVTNPVGQLAGRSRVESILGGCVLLENWDSPTGVSGKSFNLYNADTDRWEQFWVDNSGSRLHLSGALKEGRMALHGVQDKLNAQTGLRQHERITWTPNADGSVRQHWETSNDDGKTWATSFDGLYRRAASP